MKKEQDYINDLSEIRSMMERSTKFLSLSGWAGIMAGVYALIGSYIAHFHFEFTPDSLAYIHYDFGEVIVLALGVLLFSLTTAVLFSKRKASEKGDKIWNSTSKRLLISMSIPLLIGGVLILFYISNDLYALIAPTSLIFYGLSLYNAGNFTLQEVRWVGFVQLALGLVNLWFLSFGLLFWALGFGVVHLFYGVYMYLRYER
jgi:flagellar biosynthesis component FlhA